MPGTYRATVDYEGGKCEFSITFTEAGEAITDLGEIQCVVSQSSTPTPSAQVPASPLHILKGLNGVQRIETAMPKDVSKGSNDQSPKAQPVPAKKQAAKTVLFVFPDAD